MITTNVIIYSLLTAVVVVPQQVPWGAYLLRPGPQKPRLPRGLRLERAAVAFLRRATMLRIALNRLSDVPRVDIELQHDSSGEVKFPPLEYTVTNCYSKFRSLAHLDCASSHTQLASSVSLIRSESH